MCVNKSLIKIQFRVWEEIIIIGVLLETHIDVSMDFHKFSLENPRLSSETPDFH